jgi:SAM-dependent methyltransferase
MLSQEDVMAPDPRRSAQLEYSQLQPLMQDEAHRRRKAAKILRILGHFLGRDDLRGRRVLDLGSSTGFIADACAAAGGDVIGVDIDAPGLAAANDRFHGRVAFCAADGSALPLASGSIDVCVFNHIYEHVVDPYAVLGEIIRVLRDDGVVYLGLANRLGVMEPHYRLPFLSWLPPRAADVYLRATKRGTDYHERLRTRRTLRSLTAGLNVWDYTLTVLSVPDAFDADDLVPRRLRSVPTGVWSRLLPVVPTYLWVGTKSNRTPAGAPTPAPPRRLPRVERRDPARRAERT